VSRVQRTDRGGTLRPGTRRDGEDTLAFTAEEADTIRAAVPMVLSGHPSPSTPDELTAALDAMVRKLRPEITRHNKTPHYLFGVVVQALGQQLSPVRPGQRSEAGRTRAPESLPTTPDTAPRADAFEAARQRDRQRLDDLTNKPHFAIDRTRPDVAPHAPGASDTRDDAGLTHEQRMNAARARDAAKLAALGKR
jgi:hypothetical protein